MRRIAGAPDVLSFVVSALDYWSEGPGLCGEWPSEIEITWFADSDDHGYWIAGVQYQVLAP